MPRTIFACVLVALALAGCSHHREHHSYNEPHSHNSYNTPDHPGELHDQDAHRDTVHRHEHFGGNE
ncbi:MAG: hypothetical protein HY720_30870 [Planctomycetes bacterium]|nr:hypothetical protein [Planctomycetota bacterium]